MYEILLANFGFWANLALPIIATAFLYFTSREYVLKEFGIQVGATLVFVTAIYVLLFGTTTDLWDTNYYNGKIKSSSYYEEWKERVTYTESYSCGTSKSPRTCTRTKTRIDYHSPYWEIRTNLGETISITRSDYLKTKREFGTSMVRLHRSNQVSFGDGDKYVSKPTRAIPTSVGHTYENVVRAANGNVIHVKVPKESVALLVKSGKVREYPELYRGAYGETLLNRYIDTTGKTKSSSAYLKLLNNTALVVGRTKQANPIFYVTTEDRSITDAISQHWSMGKKNDVTLIMGIDDNGTIQWSDSICFTNISDFEVDMENKFKGMNINADQAKIVATYTNLVNAEFVRKPMEEFNYLKENITLEWYWQLLIFLLNLALTVFISYKFMNNYDRKR